jgi:radical SAM protein with 4Fe4S-binding SPASM domain
MIPTAEGEGFLERLYRHEDVARLPLSGSIEVTSRCNLRCVHCYINKSVTDFDASGPEISSQDMKNIIDQIVDEGCLWLLLTGGEPFVRDDFLNEYVYIVKKGVLVTIFTNGTLITPRIADSLAEFSPWLVEITLYGRTQQTFEAVTGVPGSHYRCMRGIELLIQRGIRLGLKSMITTRNRHEIWDMKAYAEDLGVEFRFDAMINARLDGSHKPLEYRISENEAVAFDVADEKRAESMREFFLMPSHWRPASGENHLYQCGAGRNAFHIDSAGRLSVCMMSRRPAWDLRRGSFRDGWQEFIPHILAQKRRVRTRCWDCRLFGFCEQCPGWAQLDTGHPEIPVDYLCKVAHLRAALFELPKEKEVAQS